VLGIFTKPVEGMTKGGFSGFFKGALQGVTGVIVKPVTGVLDAASKAAEGIKNTATSFDDKGLETRSRDPRAFYGKEQYYRTYIDSDAEILSLLHKVEIEGLENISLIASFEVFPDEKEKDDSYILALSHEAIVWWSDKRRKVLWWFKPENILKINLFPDGIQIQLKKSTPEIKVALLFLIIYFDRTRQ